MPERDTRKRRGTDGKIPPVSLGQGGIFAQQSALAQKTLKDNLSAIAEQQAILKAQGKNQLSAIGLATAQQVGAQENAAAGRGILGSSGDMQSRAAISAAGQAQRQDVRAQMLQGLASLRAQQQSSMTDYEISALNILAGRKADQAAQALNDYQNNEDGSFNPPKGGGNNGGNNGGGGGGGGGDGGPGVPTQDSVTPRIRDAWSDTREKRFILSGRTSEDLNTAWGYRNTVTLLSLQMSEGGSAHPGSKLASAKAWLRVAYGWSLAKVAKMDSGDVATAITNYWKNTQNGWDGGLWNSGGDGGGGSGGGNGGGSGGGGGGGSW